jgi:hypothetical protein
MGQFTTCLNIWIRKHKTAYLLICNAGVLQRFGVAYLVTGLVLAVSLPREIPAPDGQK